MDPWAHSEVLDVMESESISKLEENDKGAAAAAKFSIIGIDLIKNIVDSFQTNLQAEK